MAGNIFSKEAIDKIYHVKNRPSFNPLIVHIHNVEQIEELASNFPEKAQKLAKAFWPGSLTLVLPKKNVIPDWITAGKNTVGLRIPNHPVTLELLKSLDFPLAAPSANPFERISPTTAEHVAKYFPEGLKMVLDGGTCNAGIESTIVGFENDQIIIYRLGAISLEAIEKVVGKVSLFDAKKSQVVTPGMSKRHYAPNTKTVLTKDLKEFISAHPTSKIGAIRFSERSNSKELNQEVVLSAFANMEEAAQKIYSTMHYLDTLNLDFIVIEPFPNEGIGKSVNDRLNRASSLL